eukprot:1656345-Pyramimonas_sp.AAC.1
MHGGQIALAFFAKPLALLTSACSTAPANCKRRSHKQLVPQVLAHLWPGTGLGRWGPLWGMTILAHWRAVSRGACIASAGRDLHRLGRALLCSPRGGWLETCQGGLLHTSAGSAR